VKCRALIFNWEGLQMSDRTIHLLCKLVEAHRSLMEAVGNRNISGVLTAMWAIREVEDSLNENGRVRMPSWPRCFLTDVDRRGDLGG